MQVNRLVQPARIALVLLSVLALGATSAAAGTLKGTISSAKRPKRTRLKVTSDKKVCGSKPLYDPSLVVAKSGGLANAVISINKVKKGRKAKPTTIEINQKGCEYSPHVQATTVDSTVRIINSDGTLHNVHTFLDGDTMFNLAMPIKGQKTNKDLDEAGLVEFKCDVHSWMKAYVVVFKHPYFAVSNKDGSFEIDDVPPGKYKITIWHEKLGSKTKTITVVDGETATLDFSF